LGGEPIPAFRRLSRRKNYTEARNKRLNQVNCDLHSTNDQTHIAMLVVCGFAGIIVWMQGSPGAILCKRAYKSQTLLPSMRRIIFDNSEDLEEFIVADILRWPETKRRLDSQLMTSHTRYRVLLAVIVVAILLIFCLMSVR
jgi:hypothetical protein